MSDQASTRTMLQPHAAEPAAPVAKGILQRCGEPGCSGCEDKAPYLRTAAEPGHAVAGRVPSIVNEVLAAPGQSLPPDVRSFFEPRFGHDFSHVRVHANARAAESARVVGALAYTVGQEVVFGEGRHEPGLARGRRLLAHELQHVLQQGVANSTTAPAVIGDPHSALEAEAESAAWMGTDEEVAGAPYAVGALGAEAGPTGAAVGGAAGLALGGLLGGLL